MRILATLAAALIVTAAVAQSARETKQTAEEERERWPTKRRQPVLYAAVTGGRVVGTQSRHVLWFAKYRGHSTIANLKLPEYFQPFATTDFPDLEKQYPATESPAEIVRGFPELVSHRG